MREVLALMIVLVLTLPAPGRCGPSVSGRWFDSSLGRPVDVPKDVRQTPDFAQLGYKDNEAPRGIRVDLNKDGTADYILVDSGEYCGTGGCPYKLFDGRSHRSIGAVFGDPIVLTETEINGFPVLQTYGHLNAGSGGYTTYVFDGREYKVVSSVFVTTESLQSLFEDLKKLPKLTSAPPADASKHAASPGSGHGAAGGTEQFTLDAAT